MEQTPDTWRGLIERPSVEDFIEESQIKRIIR